MFVHTTWTRWFFKRPEFTRNSVNAIISKNRLASLLVLCVRVPSPCKPVVVVNNAGIYSNRTTVFSTREEKSRVLLRLVRFSLLSCTIKYYTVACRAGSSWARLTVLPLASDRPVRVKRVVYYYHFVSRGNSGIGGGTGRAGDFPTIQRWWTRPGRRQ